jgi:ankyrin repeat protein
MKTTLRVLLAGGASAKLITSRYDGTALIAAAHLGHNGVVRQLIRAGAPLDHVNNLHWTAVIEAIVLGDGGPRHQATLKALLDAGAPARSSWTAAVPRHCSWPRCVAMPPWCRC